MYKWFLRPPVTHFRGAAFFVKLSFCKYHMLGRYIEMWFTGQATVHEKGQWQLAI